MPSNSFAYRASVGLIWLLALWHSWVCRGLFVDGSAFLVQIVRREWFFDFYPPRVHAMIAGQMPIMLGIGAGVTDMHWLARLLSLGLFGLPTVLYTMALHRSKEEPVLLAAVIAMIGVVFMSTSFFIVGEYNTAYAMAILVAVRVVTAKGLTTGDGAVLAVLGFLGMRTYESMLYMGPLLATMIMWQVVRVPARTSEALTLHLSAAALFMCGMMVAADSVIRPWSSEHLEETAQQAKFFWQNMQFMLSFSAMLVVAVWALVKPEALGGIAIYRWSAVALAALALSPLLAIPDTLVRPLAKSQYVARSASGLVITAMVIFIWCYGSRAFADWRLRVVLHDKETTRRVLGFACLILVASLPADVFLTSTWVTYLDTMRATVRSKDGVIAYEDTPFSRRPNILLVENWALPSQSLALRSKPGDGIIAPPRDFTAWIPFPPSDPVDIGQHVWRD